MQGAASVSWYHCNISNYENPISISDLWTGSATCYWKKMLDTWLTFLIRCEQVSSFVQLDPRFHNPLINHCHVNSVSQNPIKKKHEHLLFLDVFTTLNLTMSSCSYELQVWQKYVTINFKMIILTYSTHLIIFTEPLKLFISIRSSFCPD